MKHSTITKNDVKVLGRVVSITSANVVASAEQIWDDKFDLINGLSSQANHSAGDGANQYDINRLFADKLTVLSEIFTIDGSGNLIFNDHVTFNNGITVNGPVNSTDLNNKYKLTVQKSSGSGAGHNGSYTLKQGGSTVGTIDISDWFLSGGSISGTVLTLTLSDPDHTQVSIDLAGIIDQNSITLPSVIANSNIGTPSAGDILYFNGTTWTLTPLKNLLYWKLDTTNHTIVPNTTNTNNYVDVATTGSIYSGALGPQ